MWLYPVSVARKLITMSVLQIRDVRLRFESRSNQPAVLDGVGLNVERGEIVTILGPSGCGKTSLLRMAAGFLAPTSGEILFEGHAVKGADAQRVLVFQQPGLYPWLSVRKNVAFGYRLQHRRVQWSRIDETLELVGLDDHHDFAPYELSGGQQQRAALARALVIQPRLLLMDEPFGALDALTRQRMQELLLRLREQLDLTVVFITHDVEEAILLGDRVLTMSSNPGRFILEQHVELPHPRTKAITLTPAFQALRGQALEALGRVTLPPLGLDALTSLDEWRQAPIETLK